MKIVLGPVTAQVLGLTPTGRSALERELRYEDLSSPTGYTSVLQPNGSMPAGLASRAYHVLTQIGEEVTVEMGDTEEGMRTVKPDIKLYPHQMAALRRMLKTRRGILDAVPRSGKTPTAAAIIQALPDHRPVLFLIERSELGFQAADELEFFLKEPVRRIGGDIANDVKSDIVVAMRQTLAPNPIKYPVLARAKLVMVDECFPAGTLVGDKAIEDIQVGDYVPAYNEHTKQIELGIVSRVFVREYTGGLMYIATDNGDIRCTPCHPFMTQRSWVRAKDITQDDELLYVPGKPTISCMQKLSTRIDQISEDPSGLHTVYNIEVDRLHTYTANGFVVHNCHHSKSAQYTHILRACTGAKRIYGFSGTPWSNTGDDINIEGNIGPVTHQIKYHDLLKSRNPDTGDPYITQPLFIWQEMPVIGGFQFADWRQAYQVAIVDNELRNQAIIDFANYLTSRNRTCVITVDELRHGRLLAAALDCPFTHGQEDMDVRRDVLTRLKRRDIPVVVSTLYREAVNIPSLDGMVNAAAKKSSIAFYQNLRNMTYCQGKQVAPTLDFIDTSAYVGKWSQERYGYASREPVFRNYLRDDYVTSEHPGFKAYDWLDLYLELGLDAVEWWG